MNPDDIAEWAAASYGLARPVACELIRSYTNDVYAVQSPDGRFVLKVYGRGWRTGPEIGYEVDLTRHLAAGGLPIARPIAGTRGEFVKEMGAGDDRRHVVLFEYALGVKPEPPFTPQLYRAFGRSIARLHALSDGFVTEHPRRPLDLSPLIDEPLALVVPLLATEADRKLLADAASRVKDKMAELAGEGLDWGPIHGDATLDNLHVTADGGVILYDLDSGGPGWRAADLQGWAAGLPEYRERWEAYLEGYSSMRPIQPADLLAAPYLILAWDIWGLKIDLEQRVLRQGAERTQAYLRERMTFIRERIRTLSRVQCVP
jgi:Ser/Thr protein kinase RdoA (MazF antagonist)